MKIFQLNIYSKIILYFLFILGIIITQRQIFYIYRGSTFFNLLGPSLMILVILYIIITAIINKISLMKTIIEIFKTISISLCLLLFSSLFITGIYWVIISNNLTLQLIVISILIFLIVDIILIFNVNKINPKEKRNIIKKILKFLNIAIIIIVTLIIVSSIFFMIYETVKPRPRWIHRPLQQIDYENIPNPSFADPIALESTRVNVRAGENTAFGMKILNTLSEKANLSIKHGENSPCGEQFTPGNDEDLLKFIPNPYLNVDVGEVVEIAGIIKTKDTILEKRNKIMGCPILVELNGKNSNITHSHIIIRLTST